MNKDEEFELFEELMTKSLNDPNAIYNTCIRVIISMSKLNEDDEEEFGKVLNHMMETYKHMGSHHDILMAALVLKEMMESE